MDGYQKDRKSPHYVSSKHSLVTMLQQAQAEATVHAVSLQNHKSAGVLQFRTAARIQQQVNEVSETTFNERLMRTTLSSGKKLNMNSALMTATKSFTHGFKGHR